VGVEIERDPNDKGGRVLEECLQIRWGDVIIHNIFS